MAATPLHFGESQRKLFGVYHHPEQRIARAPACLLFNPFGVEAIRSSRILKTLAERLARDGASVLRFDYFGSGDSEGACEAVDFQGMVRDAATAQEELEALSGARRFAWIGLGLGAAVAMRAAEETHSRLDNIFLWDPVFSGSKYLADLRRAHIDYLAQALDIPAARIERETPSSPDRLEEALGFPLSREMRAQMREFRLNCADRIANNCHLMTSTAPKKAERQLESLTGAAKTVHHVTDESAAWNSDAAMNAFLIPTDIIDYVAENAGLRS